MKTRDRILQTSLLLFNEEGEPNVTTVDIANEMGISPGNLYYHFRGKEIIIEGIYDEFDREMTDILTAPVEKSLDVKDSWFYLYVVFDHIYQYRFLYHNLSDVMQRYEKIQRRFKRLLKLKINTARSLCRDLEAHNVLRRISQSEIDVLVNQIVITIIYWFAFNAISERNNKNPEILMHEGVFQAMSLLAPYLQEDKKEFFSECKDLYYELIRKAEAVK